MKCSISRLTSAHPFSSLFIFFCHRHHMECFPFFSLSFCYLSLCVHGFLVHHSFYLFSICSSAGFTQLYWCLGEKFHKWLRGSAAGDITIIWNDVRNWSVDCCASVPKFIYFLLPWPSHGVLSFLGFENLFAIYNCDCGRSRRHEIFLETSNNVC